MINSKRNIVIFLLVLAGFLFAFNVFSRKRPLNQFERLLMYGEFSRNSGSFKLLTADGSLYIFSAHWNSNGTFIKLFMIRKRYADVQFHCNQIRMPLLKNEDYLSFEPCDSWTSPWHDLVEFGGNFISSTMCCKLIQSPNLVERFGNQSIQISVSDAIFPRVVEVNASWGLYKVDANRRFPYEFGLCSSPWYRMRNYTAKFLVEYIELHKLMGVGIMVFYLAEHPPHDIDAVLKSYAAENHHGGFQLIAIKWLLPRNVLKEGIWSYGQVLSNNDCLHRIGSMAKYILFSDLDEILVPQTKALSLKTPMTNWSVMVKQIWDSLGQNHPGVCFQSVYLPPDGDRHNSIYSRQFGLTKPTEDAKKCMIKSGRVFEFAYHDIMLPPINTVVKSVGLTFHFRECTFNLRKCPPETAFRIRSDLIPYYKAIGESVSKRLTNVGSQT